MSAKHVRIRSQNMTKEKKWRERKAKNEKERKKRSKKMKRKRKPAPQFSGPGNYAFFSDSSPKHENKELKYGYIACLKTHAYYARLYAYGPLKPVRIGV